MNGFPLLQGLYDMMETRQKPRVSGQIVVLHKDTYRFFHTFVESTRSISCPLRWDIEVGVCLLKTHALENYEKE